MYHLIFTFNLHKGTDLLSYAVDRFKANVLGRIPLPVFESAAEQVSFTARLFQELAASLEPNLMTKFFGHYDDSAVGLPRFHLPEAIDERFGPERRDETRLVSPQTVVSGEQRQWHGVLPRSKQELNGAREAVDTIEELSSAISEWRPSYFLTVQTKQRYWRH